MPLRHITGMYWHAAPGSGYEECPQSWPEVDENLIV